MRISHGLLAVAVLAAACSSGSKQPQSAPESASAPSSFTYVLQISGGQRAAVTVSTAGGTDQETVLLPHVRALTLKDGETLGLSAVNLDAASTPIECRVRLHGHDIQERSSFGAGTTCAVSVVAGQNREDDLKSELPPAACTAEALKIGLLGAAVEPQITRNICVNGWAYVEFGTAGQSGVALMLDNGGLWSLVSAGDSLCTRNSGLPAAVRPKLIPSGAGPEDCG